MATVGNSSGCSTDNQTTEETSCHLHQASPKPSQNANRQCVSLLSDPRMAIVGNPSTHNQTTEETSLQLPQAAKDTCREGVLRNHMPEESNPGIGTEPVLGVPPQTLPAAETRCLSLQIDLQPVNVPQIPRPANATSPQTATDVQTQASTTVTVNDPQLVRVQTENVVQAPQMEREFQISWGAIGLSAAMLGVYLGLLGNNKQIADHKDLYNTSTWLLYTSFFSGLIMLIISIIRPCTHSSHTFFYVFMSIAAVSGTYAISFGVYLLVEKNTFSLVMVSVLPVVLFMVAMILYFKDGIVKAAQSFWLKYLGIRED